MSFEGKSAVVTGAGGGMGLAIARDLLAAGAKVTGVDLKERPAEFDGGPVPRPDFWGGFRVRPDRVEFWQGQPSRLHDRLRYDRTDDGWRRVLLSP